MKASTGNARNILLWLIMPLFIGCMGCGRDTHLIRFYVGSSDGNLEYSIYLCGLDTMSMEFAVIDSFAGAKGPSYLTFGPHGDYLYTIDKKVGDTVSGFNAVTSFRVNSKTDRLTYMNSQSSQGRGPCHVHCTREGSYLITANYGSGNVAVFPLSPEGMIGPASSVFQSDGSGPVEGRQEGPHTHYVSLDPDESYLLSPDLGSDRVLILDFNHISGEISPNPGQPFQKLTPGAGPRHLIFHPSGDYVYVVNELNSTVTACSYFHETGTMKEEKSMSTVPDTYSGTRFPAAIRLHPNSRYLYASTRGDMSSIAVFDIGEGDELVRMQLMENVPSWPRDFNIDPGGKYLLAAGERSDEIRLYLIDELSGRLTSTDHTVNIPSPGCILFLE